MLDQDIQSYCRSRSFHRQTEVRWLSLSDADRAALLGLMQQVKAGENHLKDIIDWLEEIALRDGIAIETLLRENLSTIVDDPRLGRNDKLKRLKDGLRRLRFPRLAGIEDEIQRRIRTLNLPKGISLSVPQTLEGGRVTLTIEASSHDELRKLASHTARTIDREPMKDIFALIRGEPAERSTTY
jgi:hypothetical protein